MVTLVATAVLSPLKWRPFYTASKWTTLADIITQAVTRVRGKGTAPWVSHDTAEVLQVTAPALTNGDVVKLIMAWRAAVGDNTKVREMMPLWPQYAGVAYGWDPAKPKRLIVTKAQADAPYPRQMLAEFWASFAPVAIELDDENEPNPRLDMDGEFSDIVFQQEVKADLAQDGAADALEVKIPLICKNKDGSAGVPKCKTRMKRWPYLCTEYEKCESWHGPDIDPLTPVKKSFETLFKMALLVLIGVVLLDNKPRRSRRSRE